MTTRWPVSLVSALALIISGGLVALLVGLAVGGGAEPLLLVDPGDGVRYGLPAAKAFVHLGAALAVGALMLAAFALSPQDSGFSVSLTIAALGAALMTIASATTGFLTFLSIYLEPIALTSNLAMSCGCF